MTQDVKVSSFPCQALRTLREAYEKLWYYPPILTISMGRMPQVQEESLNCSFLQFNSIAVRLST
jgi:hypothetical protein